MAGAGATRAILIALPVRSKQSARVSACPNGPLPTSDHLLPDAVASLVFTAVRPGRLRLQHGAGRGAAARRAASRAAGAALLCLDRAGGVLWLLSEGCRARDDESTEPAGAAAYRRRPRAARRGLDLQPGVPAGRRVVFARRYRQLPAGA